MGIEGWKLVYIILGVLTVSIGILFFIFIPDTPGQARWLSTEDRSLAIERIRANQQGVINRSFRKDQVKEAFTDTFVGDADLTTGDTTDIRHGFTPQSAY
jgi:ACS family allantoate permease-like MFS transporter